MTVYGEGFVRLRHWPVFNACFYLMPHPALIHNRPKYFPRDSVPAIGHGSRDSTRFLATLTKYPSWVEWLIVKLFIFAFLLSYLSFVWIASVVRLWSSGNVRHLTKMLFQNSILIQWPALVNPAPTLVGGSKSKLLPSQTFTVGHWRIRYLRKKGNT